MALISTNRGGSKGELVKTSWTPSGNNGKQACTNATVGNYYVIRYAEYQPSAYSGFTGATEIAVIANEDPYGVFIVKATDSTITINASGTYNVTTVTEMVIQ